MFCARFLVVAKSLEGPAELESSIWASLQTLFASRTEFWALCVAEGRGAALESARAHLEAAQWWELCVRCAGADAHSAASLCARAHAADALSPALASVWIAASVNAGQLEEAARVGALAVDRWPHHGRVWFDFLSASVMRVKQDPSRRKSVSKLFGRAVEQAANDEESIGLIRNLYVRFVMGFEEGFSDHKVLKAIGNNVSSAEYVLDFLARHNMVEERRPLCARVLEQCPVLSVFVRLVELEPDDDLKRVLLLECTERFGATEPDVWLRFAELETRRGNLEEAGRIFWKAKKTLRGEALNRFLEAESLSVK